jgi:hypothetical protein
MRKGLPVERGIVQHDNTVGGLGEALESEEGVVVGYSTSVLK